MFDTTKDILGQTASMMSSAYKEEFEIGKAASLAQAVINTVEAITKQWQAFHFH